MSIAYITVGLGFGDEGKGATVHHLVKKTGAKTVVRYSGGCQCAHTVKLADGRTHKFAQWGAGTFAGARTYIGPRVVVDPVAMKKEQKQLVALGAVENLGEDLLSTQITVHPDALLTNSYFICLNRLKETLRGANRHGSCGYGIGEARSYALKYGADAIRAKDVENFFVLRQKVDILRDRFLAEINEIAEQHGDLDKALESMGLSPFCIYPKVVVQQLYRSLWVEEHYSPLNAPVVFEGAQGTLLDEWHGFHPHTTWSTVTDEYAYDLVPEGYDARTIGVTRAFTTRHGAGPLPTEFTSDDLVDANNPQNDWQGGFRWGRLDVPLLKYAADCQTRKLDGIALTWLDAVKDGYKVAVGYPAAANLQWCNHPDLKRQSRLLSNVGEIRYVEAKREQVYDIVSSAANAPVLIAGEGPSESEYRSWGLSL